MKQNVYYEDFYKSFRSLRPNQFSNRGLHTLYNYLISYEDAIGEEFDLDVIGICCDYSEYKNFQELKSNYLDVKTLEDLKDKTLVLPIEDTEGFIVQNF